MYECVFFVLNYMYMCVYGLFCCGEEVIIGREGIYRVMDKCCYLESNGS